MTTSAPHLIIAAGGTGGAHVPRGRRWPRRWCAGGWRVTLSTDARGARYTGGFPHTVRRSAGGFGHFRARWGPCEGAGAVPNPRRHRQCHGADAGPKKTVGRGGLRRLSRDPGHGGGMASTRPAACDPRTERRSGPGEPGVRAPRRCGRLWDLARPSFPSGVAGIHTGNPVRAAILARRRRPPTCRPADWPMSLLVFGGSQGRAHPVGRGPRSGGASARGGCATGCAWPQQARPRGSRPRGRGLCRDGRARRGRALLRGHAPAPDRGATGHRALRRLIGGRYLRGGPARHLHPLRRRHARRTDRERPRPRRRRGRGADARTQAHPPRCCPRRSAPSSRNPTRALRMSQAALSVAVPRRHRAPRRAGRGTRRIRQEGRRHERPPPRNSPHPAWPDPFRRHRRGSACPASPRCC